VKYNLENCDSKYSNYSNRIITNSKEWPYLISSPEWIMREWFLRQVKRAEEMYRQAIANISGAIV
jgi:hypothetical protein